MASDTIAARPPQYQLRLILGILLAVPIPMIVLAFFIYVADDFRQTPAWARDWMI